MNCCYDEHSPREVCSKKTPVFPTEELTGTKHFPPDGLCGVCGAVCDIYPDPPERGTCYKHCEDHYFQVVDREARCYHCNQPAPDDWYDSEDV